MQRILKLFILSLIFTMLGIFLAIQSEKIVLSDGHCLVSEPGWEFRLMVAIPMGIIPLAGYTVFCLITTQKANGGIFQMQNKTMIVFGIVLIIFAFSLLITREPIIAPMYKNSSKVWLTESVRKGNRMKRNAMMISNVMEYGGYCTGGIGLVFLLAGLIQKPKREKV
ncbi:MAG: hypothetical protein HF982_02975 [Desulfobacteraceae bacterium]|nr:hypothetical protein [Desulfobacteraceae bacterium]MBC2718547.1 hypothetical protein [Desulfobacteraceae bacterium]